MSRPRPVTATVTKPPWMRVPSADAAMYHSRHSLTSNGSTASLTSVLDHDSYCSEPEEKGQFLPEEPNSTGDAQTKVHFDDQQQPKEIRKVKRHTHKVESSDNLRRSASTDSGLSAWEMWLIAKAKEERRQRQLAVQQRREEKQARLAKEKEKQLKEEKAAEVRQEWVQKKNSEEKLRKKMDKLKIRHEKETKLENEERLKRKAEEVFREWMESKQHEERQRKLREKERQQKEEQEKEARKQEAEHKYQEWLKRSRKRPQSAPSKRQPPSGYNNNAPYPQPGYINPIPWQHPTVPKVKSEKPKKSRPRKYVWNPDKYF